jgi:hypothetical protein
MMLAGIIGVALAVVLLRLTQESAPTGRSIPTTPRPAPTTVEQLAEPGIVLPAAGEPPAGAGKVQADAGDGLLRVRWGQAVSGSTPRGATGYDVSWGPDGRLDRHLLVAAPELELRGLTNGTRYDVEVRSIDAYGQRSPPVRGSGVPAVGEPDPWRQTFTGLYDDFRSGSGPVPDPDRWAVQRLNSSCLRAGPGQDEEAGRLVLEVRCGSTTAVLRARVPLRLNSGDVLARIGLVTDAPIPGGQVAISLVPGPVAMLGVPPDADLRPAEPGHAVDDPNLPLGTIRAVIDASQAEIVAEPSVPRTPVSTGQLSTVLGSPGVTSRWELELASGGVALRRDGLLTATGNVRPEWTEATVLFEFTAPPGEIARLHLDAIGFTGQPGAPPPKIVDVPDVITVPHIYLYVEPGPDTRTLPATPGQSARLHSVIGPVRDCRLADLAADFGGPLVPMAPVMPGAAPAGGPYCPFAAELPANLLDLLRRGVLHTPYLRVRGIESPGSSMPVAGSFLEITLTPDAAVDRARAGGAAAVPPPGPRPASNQNRLAQLSAELRNAAGAALVPGAPVEHGRLVLDVTLDGLTGQHVTGQVGGVAGIQVLLDDHTVAGLPTTRDGPAVGGSYQFGMSLNSLNPGGHVIEARVYGTESGTRPHSIWINFQLR